MPQYRIIYLYDNGDLRSYTDVECQDDSAALAVIGAVSCDLSMELWYGERRLSRQGNRL